jgi:SAM-dependent methyltransferase
MKAKHIIKGLLTYVLPRWTYSRHTGGTNSARYCYAVFLRHLVRIHSAIGRVPLGNVAELGPGDSLGIGLAALIAGAERYYAFDVAPFSNTSRNLVVFDELVELFRARADIPGVSEIPEIKPAISNEAFPINVLTDQWMKHALEPGRIEDLRRDLLEGGRRARISYVAPWFDSSTVQDATLDWIFSQAVMEHVDDLTITYDICSRWLKPGGVMSHQIDFRSHGTAASWDGHRAYGDVAWRMIRGSRPYLINREPLSAHHIIPETFDLDLIEQILIKRQPFLASAKLASRFRAWSEEDLRTAGAFVVHRKRAV